ncbi:osmotically-inducible lipoprotein OsmE [Acerihabitans sp. TG2]|uniref:osmotically-inducible lipoprotein OsmE n=1 Tax=Acerihabitans sp. TG2 TaxID=3096008 RepID=UPI002B226694|nr:osmotically-inducible lipoprotein OsmE [Acerihabitans sp. TG2]MEA9391061.1 osmotically-inducible lipoprotein OsmE [Acerihabitans sp. TG2]
MNKTLVLAFTTATALTLLSGCTIYDRADSYMKKPVVSDVKKDMTKQQARAIGGIPATSITMINAHGTCDSYILGTRDGKPINYFVSYDQNNRVLNKGFQSCQEYDTNPQK